MCSLETTTKSCLDTFRSHDGNLPWPDPDDWPEMAMTLTCMSIVMGLANGIKELDVEIVISCPCCQTVYSRNVRQRRCKGQAYAASYYEGDKSDDQPNQQISRPKRR